MTMLETLEDKRDLVLLAEIGALIHDLGKLSEEFVNDPGGDAHSRILRRFADSHYLYFTSADEIWQYAVNWIERDLHRLEDSDRQVLSPLLRQAQMKPAQDTKDLFVLARWLAGATSGKLNREVQNYLENRYLSPILGEDVINCADPDFVPKNLREILNDTTYSPFLEEPISSTQQKAFGDFIVLHHTTYVDPLPELVQILRAGNGGCDGFDSWLDKQGRQLEKQPPQSHIATAFGHEPESQRIALDGLTSVRHRYANNLAKALQQLKEAKGKLPAPKWLKLLCDPRIGLRARTEAAFRQALGETRRPANDVTLWDHCYSTASLYKAALTKVLLEKALDEEYEFPSPSTIGWRFLRVGVDGLDFFGQAHHVTDMLGRRDALVQILDEVRRKLEIEHPLGNEVYRDENGSVFIMPALDGDTDHQALAEEVDTLVEEDLCWTRPGLGLRAELVPHLIWNDEGPVRRRENDMPDMMKAFGRLVSQAPGPVSADPQALAGWWKEPQSVKKETCTVCGVRPVGYKPKNVQTDDWVTRDKAEKRHICCVCLHRRGRRAEKWLTKEPHRTIWADEVVDVNSRFALIVGRFGLEQWLDGTLLRTMLIAPGKSKNPSPARIRRVWETTQGFWEDVQEEVILGLLTQRQRLAITPTPRNIERLDDPDPRRGLGRYHTYELQIGGLSIGVVWDPVGKELILTEYLCDLGRRLGLEEKYWKGEGNIVEGLKSWFEERTEESPWRLFEPSGYLSPAVETRYAVEVERVHCVHNDVSQYTPHIPLLTEPALFMTLVPADRAMEVVRAIKEKYEREMSKVRDRLPLHLGIVIAPRRTPLRAVLEAGRAMLDRGGEPATRSWEEWWVEEKRLHVKTIEDEKGGSKEIVERVVLTLSRNGRQIVWTVPTVMGDGETPDRWYPHLLKRPPSPGEEPDVTTDLVHVCDLDKGQAVHIAPSTFDFEFLDTTARRFEIHYDEKGRRPRRTRPFLLDDLERLETLWTELCHLKKSQRYQVIATIEATREAWFGADREGRSLKDGVFRQFVRDTLAGAAWPDRRKWKDICQDGLDEQLVTAGVAGELADLAELHMEILKE